MKTKTMLIVDDVAVSRTVVKALVSKLDIGIEIKVIGEAATGKDAVARYKELKPDIVVMDLAMHEMTGMEALKEIMIFDPNATVMIISSVGDQRYKIYEATDAGAKAVLKKPIDKDQFATQLKNLLE